MKRALTVLLAILMVAAFALVGCNGASSSSSAADVSSTPASSSGAASSSEPADDHDPVTMMVAAAASLEYSYTDELIPMFQELYPWITVEGTYDSSGKLQTQIEEGLEADVFMSAAMKQMTALEEGGLINPASVVKLLENEIVLITGTSTETSVTSFEDIDSAAGNIALGDPESVPAGQYAREALTSLGVYDAIQPKVSLGTNVTEVLNQVAEGSAEVGIVYATDAATTENVKVIATAPEGSLETKVIYPVCITANAPQKEAAKLFVEFLQSPEAIAVFEKYGFKSNI